MDLQRLALNNLAIILTNYLISGPWQPPGRHFPWHATFQDARCPALALPSAIVSPVCFDRLHHGACRLRGTFWGWLKALGKFPLCLPAGRLERARDDPGDDVCGTRRLEAQYAS
jgi:hypothetical protein